MSDDLSLNESNKFESAFALSETFDFNIDAKLKQKYIILSSPRTGSTMLASALYHTGLAGAPFEYFHPQILKARNNPELRPNELNVFLEEMIRRRTSPNGYFGMALYFGQFEYLFGANPTIMSMGMRFLSEFDKRILLYRRDKILQSVSELLAREGNIWSATNISNNGVLGRAPNPNDVVELSEFLRTFVLWDHYWRKVNSRLDGSCLEIAYEDLCSDPQAEFGKIFDYLGLHELRTRRIAVPAAKQMDVANEMKRAYLEKIGVFDTTNLELLEEVMS